MDDSSSEDGSGFDAESEAEYIFTNAPRYDEELDENWIDSHFEEHMESADYTREQAIAVAEELISMAYMPSGTHSRNIMAAARKYTDESETTDDS